MKTYVLASAGGIAVSLAILVAIPATIARVIVGVTCESQVHLNELLLTMLVAGAVAAPLSHFTGFIDTFSTVEEQAYQCVFTFVAFLLVGAGSAWGWSVAKRLGMQKTWPRIGYLVAGWLAIPGAIPPFFFIFGLMGFQVHGGREPGMGYLFLYSGACSFLIVPAIILEFRARNRAALERRAFLINPHPEPRVAPAKCIKPPPVSG